MATEFADRRARRDRLHYATRGSRLAKVRSDFANGALGDRGVARLRHIFGDRGGRRPDFDMHHVRHKSYDPDLHLCFKNDRLSDVRAQVKMHVCYRYGETCLRVSCSKTRRRGARG